MCHKQQHYYYCLKIVYSNNSVFVKQTTVLTLKSDLVKPYK